MDDQQQKPFPTDEDKEEAFIRERMKRWDNTRQQAPYDPFGTRPRKSKIIAGLLAFLIPGTGHLYLGLMQRGMMVMLLLILDIFAIVHFSTASGSSIPLIVLFSLFVPVIYFYNIFDALQQTDRVNGQWGGLPGGQLDNAELFIEKPLKKLSKGSGLGYLLVIAGIFLFLVSNKPAWLNKVFDLLGSSIGAIVLIVIGVAMFLKETTKK
jgi:hypothetical protein